MILTAGMAAYTQSDADAVRAAILALATGQRVASVSYAGPPARTVQYVATDLDKLKDLLADIESSLRTTPGFRLAKTCKGL